MERLDVSLISEIISFIGPNQYRFVAGINKSFRWAHLQVFPYGKKTALNASTLELAKICFGELNVKTNVFLKCELCQSAARHGNLAVLQYLRSVNSEWNEYMCS